MYRPIYYYRLIGSYVMVTDKSRNRAKNARARNANTVGRLFSLIISISFSFPFSFELSISFSFPIPVFVCIFDLDFRFLQSVVNHYIAFITSSGKNNVL